MLEPGGSLIPKLEAKDLRYAVGGAAILKGVDLAVGEGEIACVTGPSGSGKSTLLRALNRLVEPTAGEVFLDGVPTGTMDPLVLRRRVGMIFQLPALSGPTVEEAVLYGPRILGGDADVAGLLGAVGLDSALASRDPQGLSVGQQQRVSIARTLALQPEVLLMDEPTSALDESARDRIEGLVKNLNRSEGLTFVVVSHDLGQVERLADRVVLVDAGHAAGEWDHEEFDGGGARRSGGSSRGSPRALESLGTVTSALLALGLVAVAVALSFYEGLDLERDIGIAVVRSFVQLAAIGYVIELVFGLESLGYVLLLLVVMVGFAGWTSARRARGIPRALPLATVAVGVAAVSTLGLLLLLGVVPPTGRYLIPLGGMVVGNSMNTTSLTLSRIRDEIKARRAEIEASLALGATSRQAVAPILKSSLRDAMIPLVDSTKTAGLVFLPGAMAGMIIGGADPLEAVRLQMVVLYMLLGSVSIAAIIAGLLSYRSFFTPRHQLRAALLGGE